MTEREILIANSKDQSKYRIVTGAETLGELQDAIASNVGVYKMVGQSWVNNPTPIDIVGLTFTEGITKTQLLSRDSALPTNVSFKGQTTNNLVMLLTNTNKQIRSGATSNRSELYILIKRYNLQDAIKNKYGKNYTMVGNTQLADMINAATSKQDKKEAISEAREELAEGKQKEQKTADVKAAPHSDLIEVLYSCLKYMVKQNILSPEDIKVLGTMSTSLAEENQPKITADDVDAMMWDIHH